VVETTRKKPTVLEWVETITDNNLHHIGEYFCKTNGLKSCRNKTDGGYTKSFKLWMYANESDFQNLPKEFEVVRDTDCGFFIRRKL
jgi:hypothetical protein